MNKNINIYIYKSAIKLHIVYLASFVHIMVGIKLVHSLGNTTGRNIAFIKHVKSDIIYT